MNFTSDYKRVDGSSASDLLVLTHVYRLEAMSSLYQYDLTLTVDGELTAGDINGLLSNPCWIEEDDGSRVVSGILSELRLEGFQSTTSGHKHDYKATLVPQLWRTTLTYRTRVFLNKNIQQLVNEVLGDYDITPTWLLEIGISPSLDTEREYTVQFEETDFDFINRHLEHWGIFYFFKQGDSGEDLYITDDPNAAINLDSWVRSSSNSENAPSSDASEQDYTFLTWADETSRNPGRVFAIHPIHRRSSPNVVLREYNDEIPAVYEKTSPENGSVGEGTNFSFTDRWQNEEEGVEIAQIRLDQLLGHCEQIEGECWVDVLAPGHRFQLNGCPASDLDITYLVTSVEQKDLGVTGDDGSTSFTAVPLERQNDNPHVIPYRSQRKTPWPKIEGYIVGFIDGESSTNTAANTVAPIDHLGRYKVIMPMDSAIQFEDEPYSRTIGQFSRWIRRVQPLAGFNQGMHFPLHVGTEVAITHMNGDPDRPIIIGAVPNGNTIPPVVGDVPTGVDYGSTVDAQPTKNRIVTRSGVMVEIDDDAN